MVYPMVETETRPKARPPPVMWQHRGDTGGRPPAAKQGQKGGDRSPKRKPASSGSGALASNSMVSVATISDSASAYFHGWLGGYSKEFPNARREILEELAGEKVLTAPDNDADALYEVGKVAFDMSFSCGCWSARLGHGCEHEAGLDDMRHDWLQEQDVNAHIDGGECSNCSDFTWLKPVA